MSRLFDELDDESTPSAGQEIGAAISTAMESVAESNKMLAEKLSAAMVEALSQVKDKPPVSDAQPERKEVRQWRFDVHRDAEGRMTHVVANAI